MSLHDLLAGGPCDPLLGGRRVLVVEDEYLIAEDLCEQLLLCRAEVMGPVASVADVLALLDAGPAPDMAVLDIGLGGEKVYPVADVLWPEASLSSSPRATTVGAFRRPMPTSHGPRSRWA